MPKTPEETRPAPLPRQEERVARAPDVARLSTPELVARIAQDAQNLVKAEIQLAKTELRGDLEGAVTSVKRLGAAIAFGVAAAVMLLVTAVLALALVMPAWAAALVVAVALLAAAAVGLIMAARARPKPPLERTRRNLKEDLRWAKQTMA